MEIRKQKIGRFNEEDRIALAAILVRAGYTVALDKVKVDGKTEYTVKFFGDGGEPERQARK